MGVVYKAWDRSGGRLVALKTLRDPAGGSADRDRFATEIRALATLRHPGVVALHDAGRAGDGLFFTMDYLEGETLDSRLARGLPGPEEIAILVAIVEAALDALGHIHEHGLVHGDLKPSNVMLLAAEPAEGNDSPPPDHPPAIPRVVLLDFGLARRQRARPADRSGTPLYMPPEQMAGEPTDERADLYSIGAILYHAITTCPPFQSVAATLARDARPEPPRLANPACPEPLERLILSLLERRPWRRPATCEEVRDALSRALDATRRPPSPRAPSLLPPAFAARQESLERLRAAALAAFSGRGGIVSISGPAGSGKTWLLSRSGLASEWLVDSDARFVRVSLRAKTSGADPLDLLHRELEAVLAPREQPSPPPDEGHGPDGGPAPHGELPARLARERSLRAILEALDRALRRGPVALALEDIDEGGEVGSRLVERLRGAVAGRALLLILTCRAEARRGSGCGSSSLEAWPEAKTAGAAEFWLELGALGDHDVEDLVEASLAPRGRPDAELVEWLAERARGCPLGVRHWLRVLLDRGSLCHDPSGPTWRLEASSDFASGGREVPDLLAGLPPAERETLVAAALLGPPFDEPLLLDLLARAGQTTSSAAEAARACRKLAAAGLLVETPESLGLPPELDADELSESLSSEQRRVLHREAGRLRAERGLSDDPGLWWRVAEHLEAAGETQEAARHFARAGRLAAHSHSDRRAIEALERARGLQEDGSGEISLELSEVLARTGELDRAVEVLGELEERLEPAPESAGAPGPSSSSRSDLPLRLRAREALGRLHHRRGDLERALECFQWCVRSSPRSSAARAIAHLRSGGVAFDRGELEEAIRHYRASLAIPPAAEDADWRVAAWQGLALAQRRRGEIDDAITSFEGALAAAEEAGDQLTAATILNNLGNLLREQGETGRAVDCLRRSTGARERCGDAQGLAICLNNMARILVQEGDLERAERETERALGTFREIADRKGVLIAACNLGEIFVLRGKPRRALELLASVEALADEAGLAQLDHARRVNRARAELELGRPEYVEEELRAVIDEGGDSPLWRDAIALCAEASIDRGLGAQAEVWLAELSDPPEGAPDRPSPEEAVARMRAAIERGDPEAALELGRATLRAGGPKDRHSAARVQRELARAYRDLGPDWADRTERALELATEAFEAMGCPHDVAETGIERGLWWKLLGEDALADQEWRAAAETFRALGLSHRIERIEELRGRP